MTACGVWPASRGLVAVLVDGAGRVCFTAAVACTDSARWGLAQRLAAVGADLVVDESHLPADPIAFAARRAGVRVWVAGPPLVGLLRAVTGAARGPPKSSAMLLARLPAVPWLRTHLRRLEPEDDPRQVTLL